MYKVNNTDCGGANSLSRHCGPPSPPAAGSSAKELLPALFSMSCVLIELCVAYTAHTIYELKAISKPDMMAHVRAKG